MKECSIIRRYAFSAVFVFAALLFALPAQAQYEMDRNMTADELNEIHREVEELYGENPGDMQQEKTAPSLPQTLPPAAIAAIPEIKKAIQKTRRTAPRKPAAQKSPPRDTRSGGRQPPAYQHQGSRRIR